MRQAMTFAARLLKMDEELDLEALKAAALASLKAKKSAETKKLTTQHPDELEALRAAALLSKSGKYCSSNGSGDGVAAGPGSTSSAASKFDRQEEGMDSGEDSEFSILEEIEQGNIIEDSEGSNDLSPMTTDNAATVESDERPIPELLEDVLDIAEFDDEELLLEEDLPAKKSVKRSSQSQTLDRRKDNFNGTSTHSRSTRDDRKRPSPPVHRRSRSPTLRRKHTTLHSGSSSSHKSTLLPDKQPERRKPPTLDRDESASVSQRKPSLTAEQQETLLRRQKKFSKTKVDTTKGTVKLNKTKEEESCREKTESRKSKTVATKTEREVVKDAAVEVLTSSSSKTEPAAPKVTKRKITDRLGGYVKAEPVPEPVERKKRLVSIDNSSRVSEKAAEVNSDSRESDDEFDMRSSEFSDVSSDASLESPAEVSTSSRSQLSTHSNPISKLSLHKRNIWSSRAPSNRVVEETLTDSRGRQVDARRTLEGEGRARGSAISRIENSSSSRAPVYGDVRERLSHRRDQTDRSSRRDNGDLPSLAKVHSRSSSIGQRSEARAPPELPSKSDTTGKNRKELELDERIRKIKEMNAKREQRQKEIEKEKLLYG